MQSKKFLSVLLVILLLVLLGALGFLFKNDLENLVGIKNDTVAKKDFRGENLTYNTQGKTIVIPPNFPSETLDYLKSQFTEKAGLPLRLERKGNPLPFGIP